MHRISGIAYLLTRAMEHGGLMEYVISSVINSGENTNLVEDYYIVRVKRQFNNHIMIGRGRAREIVINIILPFVYSWAQENLREDLSQQLLTLYQNYSKSGENGITREMGRLLVPTNGRIVNSAQRQQGLVHIAKTFCYHRMCTNCPVFKQLELTSVSV